MIGGRSPQTVGVLKAGTLALALTWVAGAVSAEEGQPGLWSRLQRIESAFRQGDATSLRLSLSSAGKVRIDLKDLTDGPASYAPGQLQVIFDQIFEDYHTRDFAFRKQDVTVSSSGTAFARGRWVRRTRDAQEAVDTLTFTLREEGGDWRVHEILSSR